MKIPHDLLTNGLLLVLLLLLSPFKAKYSSFAEKVIFLCGTVALNYFPKTVDIFKSRIIFNKNMNMYLCIENMISIEKDYINFCK